MQHFYFFDLNLVKLKQGIFKSNEARIIFQDTLYDWYATGLWNSCYGKISSSGTRVVVNCTAPHQRYWFNPYEAPGIGEIMSLLQVDMDSALSLYKKASTALFYLWVFSLVFVLIQALAGFTSLFGRGWGISITFATVSVVMFSILTDKINEAINNKVNFTGNIAVLGTPMQTTAWVAAGFALFAWLAWSVSTCCCWSRTWGDNDCSLCKATRRQYKRSDASEEERANVIGMTELRNSSSQSMVKMKR
ncbi:hypothetical protein KEM56_002012 [Ascosphaera pollenicola]|nr:hypothetical protein KEM56_002012 [Ascosphaera pollenicola]